MTYVREELNQEVVAPSGYYTPMEEVCLDYNGRRVFYTLGSACIEASCCGIGSWKYLRVEGYAIADESAQAGDDQNGCEIDTVVDDAERADMRRLLLEKHPGIRIEFR